MPKNIEDIIPSNRRSIRDIPIPSSRRHPAAHHRVEEKEEVPTHTSEPITLPHINTHPHRLPRRGGRKGVWLSVIVAIIVLVFAGLSLFQSATLAYVPKSADLSFNGETYSAHKTGDGALLFSVVKISGNKGVPVAATGEEPVSTKSGGTIVIYNKTSAPQQLVQNTRFETSDGKVYRIQSAVTVPAVKTVAGASQPGSIEAIVSADQPGPAYNIALSDFTIPGLKGTPKYSTIYARSKTAMTGGATGTQKKVSPDVLASAKTSLEASLKQDLITQAQSQVPQDFVLFPALSTISYEDQPQTNQTNTGVTINEKGDFFGVMFKKGDFARYIASKKADLASSDQVSIPSFDNLVLAFGGTSPADLLQADGISFTIVGPAKLVWITDEAGLKSDLVGQSKKGLPAILEKYPSIESANAILRPFWKSSFPADSSKITIKEKAI